MIKLVKEEEARDVYHTLRRIKAILDDLGIKYKYQNYYRMSDLQVLATNNNVSMQSYLDKPNKIPKFMIYDTEKPWKMVTCDQKQVASRDELSIFLPRFNKEVRYREALLKAGN